MSGPEEALRVRGSTPLKGVCPALSHPQTPPLSYPSEYNPPVFGTMYMYLEFLACSTTDGQTGTTCEVIAATREVLFCFREGSSDGGAGSPRQLP